MISVEASEIATNFDEWHDKARREPVVVTSCGRDSVVLLSVEIFDALTRNYREAADTAELGAAVAQAIEHREIPEEYRWNSTDADVSEQRRGY